MSNYENMIIDLVKGETPKQKYDNLKAILQYSEMMCYPRRGTQDDSFDIYDFARFITPHIKNPNSE